MREEEYILNGYLAGKQHGQALYAKAYACRRRHAILQCTEKIIIDKHGFFIATLHVLYLLFKALALLYGGVELAVGIGYFLAIDYKLKALYEAGLAAVLFGNISGGEMTK